MITRVQKRCASLLHAHVPLSRIAPLFLSDCALFPHLSPLFSRLTFSSRFCPLVSFVYLHPSRFSSASFFRLTFLFSRVSLLAFSFSSLPARCATWPPPLACPSHSSHLFSLTLHHLCIARAPSYDKNNKGVTALRLSLSLSLAPCNVEVRPLVRTSPAAAAHAPNSLNAIPCGAVLVPPADAFAASKRHGGRR